jgi:hypothetical protein
MESSKKLEKFMKNCLKLLRRAKDPSCIITILKHIQEVIEKEFSGKRKPKKAAKKSVLPAILISKELGNDQTEVCHYL